MTTEQTTTGLAPWLEMLAPKEMRDEGAALVAAVTAWRDTSAPLLQRVGRFFEAEQLHFHELSAQLDVLDARGTSHDRMGASDGLGTIVGMLTHAYLLNGMLSEMGVDPDGLRTGPKEVEA